MAAALTLCTAPAGAVTNGQPDGNGHPYAGVLVDDYITPGYFQRFCSGTLIAPRVMLSAAHCFYGTPIDEVWASFDPVYRPGTSSLIHGTAVIDPSYSDYKGQYGRSNPRDIAVVHLDQAPPITPAKLPTAGLLSTLDLRNHTLTAVGYGRTRVDTRKGPNHIEPNFDPDVRYVATSGVLNLVPYFVTLTSNPSTGYGGGCFGDSGSGDLLDRTDVVVSIEATGDAVCRAAGVSYRLDTAPARQFLASQGVPLP
ncbi:MAG TPA: trypsin-like serine protease [Thermoleophilaceae bacterium]|nr:trypsin-like serine protease [Thermoleophilaceae bacterium]